MGSAWGEDPPSRPAALTPEVQTAEWAKAWWMPRHEQKLAEKAGMEQIDLVWIGDSITHGWEESGKPIWEQYYVPRHAFNLGFSGDRTEQVLWRLQHGELDGVTPKLVVIMIGTNNAGHRQDPAEQTAAGVQAIINELRQRVPDSKILLLAIFPRGAEPDDPLRKLNDATNKLLAAMADQKQIFYADIGAAFLDQDGRLPASIMPDFLHPNADGYAIWAARLEPVLKPLLGES
jgi:beta-glucosidase